MASATSDCLRCVPSRVECDGQAPHLELRAVAAVGLVHRDKGGLERPVCCGTLHDDPWYPLFPPVES
jgi:hypothetical protein